MFSKGREKGSGFGWVGKWGGSDRSLGEGNHNRDIFQEKNLFSIKIVDYLHLRKDICDNVVNENKIILKQI